MEIFYLKYILLSILQKVAFYGVLRLILSDYIKNELKVELNDDVYCRIH